MTAVAFAATVNDAALKRHSYWRAMPVTSRAMRPDREYRSKITGVEKSPVMNGTRERELAFSAFHIGLFQWRY